ncbi:hypothetical protein BLOT_011210 [Blomia tropicalis]|nr:hypothetical protein BLOT_011210 [Blomia tropicalis]
MVGGNKPGTNSQILMGVSLVAFSIAIVWNKDVQLYVSQLEPSKCAVLRFLACVTATDGQNTHIQADVASKMINIWLLN